jgi:hypothetical protein
VPCFPFCWHFTFSKHLLNRLVNSCITPSGLYSSTFLYLVPSSNLIKFTTFQRLVLSPSSGDKKEGGREGGREGRMDGWMDGGRAKKRKKVILAGGSLRES